LHAKDIKTVTVVIRNQDHRLKEYLSCYYQMKFNLEIVTLTQEDTIIDSLYAGLRSAGDSEMGLARVILGDTYITDSFQDDSDFIYVQEIVDPKLWCVVDIKNIDGENQILGYLDKKDFTSGHKWAVVGYYHLQHGSFLVECVKKALNDGETELSQVLERYGTKYPVYAKKVLGWYDFGHIENFVKARSALLRSRYFNSLTIDPVLHTITKKSLNNEKLQDELDWYINVPDKLKVLTPRIISSEVSDGQLLITQEYYGYPTLAELYLYSDLSIQAWVSILKQVFRIHTLFREYEGHLETEDMERVYISKTFERLELIHSENEDVFALINKEKLRYNDSILFGIYPLKELVIREARRLAKNARISVIHGDYCFSNILFDLTNQITRLIDPRGRFGRKGVYGDSRYDVAKLRHSICGLYDFILADLFILEETKGGYKGEVNKHNLVTSIAQEFDQMLIKNGYILDEIRFIEGLLFISMLSMHKDEPKQQKMMYLTGIKLLNEVLR